MCRCRCGVFQRDAHTSHFFVVFLIICDCSFGLLLSTQTQDFPKLHHLSTGDLLRQHVREQTALGRQAAAYMQAGDLVPDALMIDLLMQDATPYLEEGKSLLLDGFPRNLEQAVALESVAHIDYVVNLDIPTETIVERIADRWIHAPSGRVYSYSYKPPLKPGIDDVTGEALVQREDDKPESVRTRLAAYDKVSRSLYGIRCFAFSRFSPPCCANVSCVVSCVSMICRFCRLYCIDHHALGGFLLPTGGSQNFSWNPE